MKAITNHYYCARDKMQSAFKIFIKMSAFPPVRCSI